jgi:hypothetical protein
VSTSSRFAAYHIPDDGTRYAPGEVVCLDRSSGRLRIIQDPAGAFEVMSCRPATEYGGDPPLLRIGLRKREASPVEHPDPWAPWRSWPPDRDELGRPPCPTSRTKTPPAPLGTSARTPRISTSSHRG